jgi:hypothetical protein
MLVISNLPAEVMMSGAATHENFRANTEVKVGSERSFGLVFTAVFTIVALLPLTKGGEPRLWALAPAAAFLVTALFLPKALRPLNLIWFKFGLLLHKIVNPLVMGLLFFFTVMPVGVLMRMSGKDPLRLRRDSGAASYWIVRAPPGPAPETLKNQF